MTKLFKQFASLSILCAFALLTFSPALVFGADITGQMGAPLTGLSLPSAGTGTAGEANTLKIIGNLINGVLSLLGIIFLVLIIYAGFKWMIAMGKEEEVTKAKEVLKAAVIGLVVVMSAYAIAFFVTSQLEKALK